MHARNVRDGEIHQRERGESHRRLVASRRRALEDLRSAVLVSRPGPLLVTGEPGAGKTWLAARLLDSLAPGWRALNVEVTGALDAIEFHRMIGHSLGLTTSDRLGAARLMAGAALQDARRDGRRWILV